MTTPIPPTAWGRAAEILGVTPAFLRGPDAAGLLTAQRREGGHRRYWRYQLRIAGRAHELVDTSNPLDASCWILILQDQLAEAQRIDTDLRHELDERGDDPA
ncbi:MerR family DNA-binding transcriptional regulator [Nocardia salmonicida]